MCLFYRVIYNVFLHFTELKTSSMEVLEDQLGMEVREVERKVSYLKNSFQKGKLRKLRCL